MEQKDIPMLSRVLDRTSPHEVDLDLGWIHESCQRSGIHGTNIHDFFLQWVLDRTDFEQEPQLFYLFATSGYNSFPWIKMRVVQVLFAQRPDLHKCWPKWLADLASSRPFIFTVFSTGQFVNLRRMRTLACKTKTEDKPLGEAWQNAERQSELHVKGVFYLLEEYIRLPKVLFPIFHRLLDFEGYT